jgi:hypothetical protein
MHVKPWIIREDLLQIHNAGAVFRLCSMQLSENQKEPAGLQKKQVANKASSQSMQEEIVNSNAMDDMFVAFTIVQQIMTGLSGTASEEEEVSIITKAVFSLLKRNGGNNS